MKKIEVGNIYAWDTDGMLSTCHVGTYTVKVLAVHERHRPKSSMFNDFDYDDGSPIAPLVECESIQTGEQFDCDAGHLTDIPTCLSMYKAMKEEVNEYFGIDKDIVIGKMKRLSKILRKSFKRFDVINF